MRIIISPAKKMRVDRDSFPVRDLPILLPRAEVLAKRLRSMSYEELKDLWRCNDHIAAVNVERLQNMDLRHGLTPAILSYDGIQYQYMAPGVFTEEELEYVQGHLRILSGFYGVLRPFDGVTPYRLEMQAQLSICESKNLYSYWGNSIAEAIWSETDYVIDLASKEYSQCVSRYQPADKRLITCVFGERKGGRIIEKGTLCKMARGEMVRYMAELQVEDPEALRDFDRLGYRFSEEESGPSVYVYLKESTKQKLDAAWAE